jgi:cytochrome c oxidase subunit 2
MGDLRFLVAALGIAVLISVGVSAAPPEPRKIQVTATEFEFQPNRIELKLGETVAITFASMDADVRHDFACKDLNLEKMVFEKDKPVTVAFTPEKAGTFEFQCAEACGVGHAGMNGRFVVTP